MIYEVYDSSNFLIKDAHISYNSEGTAQSSHVRRHYPFVSIEKYPYAQEKLAQPRNTAIIIIIHRQFIQMASVRRR